MAIPFPELTFAWRGVRFLIVDAAGAGVARWLPEGDDGGSGPPAVCYVVEPWAPAWGGGAGRYRVSRDGHVRYLGSSGERLAAWLRADLAAQAARHAGDDLPVLADAVAWRQRAILLLRRGGIGISTLTAELRRRGAAHCAERIAVIDAAGRVHGAGGLRTPSAPPLALAVAITYRPSLAWQARSVTGARAVLPLLAGAPAGGALAQRLRRAARLAPGLVTLQGQRGEAVDAAPRILAALDELLDGQPATPVPGADARRWLARARGALAVRGAGVAADAHEVA